MTPHADPVDIDFNFWSDCDKSQDPDKASPTLHRYHRLLWAKELPSGRRLELEDARPVGYLAGTSGVRDGFDLSSDAIVQTYRHWKRPEAKRVVAGVSLDEQRSFYKLSYTMGGFVLFPRNRVDALPSINQARGTSRAIDDRFDLTLECIRIHYAAEGTSPLTATLARYDDFFDLFTSFQGYVEHFLLQDLLTSDGGVRFWLAFDGFDGFEGFGIPSTPEQYASYRQATMSFLQARNSRIAEWVDARA